MAEDPPVAIDIGPHSATWGDIGKGIVVALVPFVIRELAALFVSLVQPKLPRPPPPPAGAQEASGTP